MQHCTHRHNNHGRSQRGILVSETNPSWKSSPQWNREPHIPGAPGEFPDCYQRIAPCEPRPTELPDPGRLRSGVFILLPFPFSVTIIILTSFHLILGKRIVYKSHDFNAKLISVSFKKWGCSYATGDELNRSKRQKKLSCMVQECLGRGLCKWLFYFTGNFKVDKGTLAGVRTPCVSACRFCGD